MPKERSQDVRDLVLATQNRGVRADVIVEMFGVSASWARRVRQVFRDEGRTSALPRGGARHRKIDRDKLAALVRAKPDSTLRELKEGLGITCSDAAICAALKKLDLSYKKRQSMRPSRTAPMSRPGVSNGGSCSAPSTR